MDAQGADGTPDPQSATRDRLNELAETQGWVHHVADLDSGRVATTPLDRPVAPLSRAKRLARLGHHLEPSKLGGPAFRLTARRPYQASPEAYLVASNASIYLPFDDTIIWEVPREHTGSPRRGIDFYFADSPSEAAVVSLSLSGKAWPGTVGSVEMVVYRDALTVEIPIGESFATHTVDLAVPPGGSRSLEIAATIVPAVELLTFRSLTFGPGFILHPPLNE